ncbi:hypothetical protein ACTFIV_006765 [Dictyostelium citrinum]
MLPGGPDVDQWSSYHCHPLTRNNNISLRFDLSVKPVYHYQAETIRNDTRGNDALNNGTGHLETIVPLIFSSTFNSVPTVTGFDLVFYAWGNTKLQGLFSNYVVIQTE